MKTNALTGTILFLLLVAMMSSCNQAPKSGHDSETIAEAVDYTEFRNEFLELIRDSPKGIDDADFLASVGASYVDDITLPLIYAEKAETRNEIALVTGMYIMDVYYANAFGRYDVVLKNVKVVDQLVDKLGVFHDRVGYAGIDLYENNKDSINAFILRDWHYGHNYTASGDHPEVLAMVFVGTNIEAMYLLSQLTLYAKDSQAMTDHLMQKGQHAGLLLRLLEILSADEAIAPYYEKLQPVVAFFETRETIDHDDLVELAALIESIRNKVIS